MIKKLGLIVGIVIFLLICSAYMVQFGTSGSEYSNNIESGKVERGDVIYKGILPMPIENFICVTSKYGKRQASGVVTANHTGIDMCGTEGSKILSVGEGEVTFAGKQNGYGNCVEIKHTDEQGKVFYSFYAHMRDNSLQVSKGQVVSIGQVIGIQGSTGNSTGDHLHFEIRTDSGSNKYAIDPAPYLFTEKESNNG